MCVVVLRIAHLYCYSFYSDAVECWIFVWSVTGSILSRDKRKGDSIFFHLLHMILCLSGFTKHTICTCMLNKLVIMLGFRQVVLIYFQPKQFDLQKSNNYKIKTRILLMQFYFFLASGLLSRRDCGQTMMFKALYKIIDTNRLSRKLESRNRIKTEQAYVTFVFSLQYH